MISTPNMTEKKLANSENKDNSNNNKLYELKNSGSKIHFGNNILRLTEAEDDIPSFHRNIIFAFFLLSNLFLNYDTGVIPASLIKITQEINFNYSEQALIGSLVYLGLSFASLFVSMIFSKFGPSKVCSLILLLNCISCFTFSLSSNKIILFSMRFLMGATEAFIVIYGPVWVNNYSPLEYSTTWMGILHSCIVLGVVTGYVTASIIINFFGKYFTWRFAIQIQGFAEIFFALFFWFENDEYINVDVRKTISINEIELENKNNINTINQEGNKYFLTDHQPQRYDKSRLRTINNIHKISRLNTENNDISEELRLKYESNQITKRKSFNLDNNTERGINIKDKNINEDKKNNDKIFKNKKYKIKSEFPPIYKALKSQENLFQDKLDKKFNSLKLLKPEIKEQLREKNRNMVGKNQFLRYLNQSKIMFQNPFYESIKLKEEINNKK